MDRRRAAAALLALAACFACSTAAPTATDHTALELVDGRTEGCYYNFQHYGEGDRIMTNEPCLNCTCHNRMLMCYLRVCPFTKAIGQDCTVEKRADQCCPIVTCPDVPVDLLTSTSTSSPAEYGATGLGKQDKYGCTINGKYFSEGSKVPPTPNKPCEHCYCIRNMTTCVMQECTLHVDGCTPIYHKDVCCPVRYSCDHPEDEIPLLDDMTTTVRPTPGFLLTTTTTMIPVTQASQECVHEDQVFPDGAHIKTEKACEHCYCMKGDIVCVVQGCGTPMENEGKNCTALPLRSGQCCPDTYICEGDEHNIELTTEIIDQSTMPPRRVGIEGSGYRNEPDEPFKDMGTVETDVEGSGDEYIANTPIDIESSSTDTKSSDGDEKILDTTTHQDITASQTTESGKEENYIFDIDSDKIGSIIPDHNIIPYTTEASSEFDTLKETKTTVSEEGPTIDEFVSKKEEIFTTESVFRKEDDNTDSTTLLHEEEKKVTVSSNDQTEETPHKEPEFTDSTEFILESAYDKKPTTESTKDTSDYVDTTKHRDDMFESQTESVDTDKQPEDKLLSETTIDKEPPVTQENIKLSEVQATTIESIYTEINENLDDNIKPARIPGEGDCLLNGVTYSNNTNVPRSNNCHTSCKCISSIIKCDPIICSPPPEYIENMNDCQPIYDSPDSCCPTYVCSAKETIPPQSHSQMSGTESPKPIETAECIDGNNCGLEELEKHPSIPAEPCLSEDCIDKSKTPEESICTSKECAESAATMPPKHEDCSDGKCLVSPIEGCEGENCNNDLNEKPIDVNYTADKELHVKDSNACSDKDGCPVTVDTLQEECANESCRRKDETKSENELTLDCLGKDCKTDNDVALTTDIDEDHLTNAITEESVFDIETATNEVAIKEIEKDQSTQDVIKQTGIDDIPASTESVEATDQLVNTENESEYSRPPTSQTISDKTETEDVKPEEGQHIIDTAVETQQTHTDEVTDKINVGLIDEKEEVTTEKIPVYTESSQDLSSDELSENVHLLTTESTLSYDNDLGTDKITKPDIIYTVSPTLGDHDITKEPEITEAEISTPIQSIQSSTTDHRPTSIPKSEETNLTEEEELIKSTTIPIEEINKNKEFHESLAITTDLPKSEFTNESEHETPITDVEKDIFEVLHTTQVLQETTTIKNIQEEVNILPTKESTESVGLQNNITEQTDVEIPHETVMPDKLDTEQQVTIDKLEEITEKLGTEQQVTTDKSEEITEKLGTEQQVITDKLEEVTEKLGTEQQITTDKLEEITEKLGTEQQFITDKPQAITEKLFTEQQFITDKPQAITEILDIEQQFITDKSEAVTDKLDTELHSITDQPEVTKDIGQASTVADVSEHNVISTGSSQSFKDEITTKSYITEDNLQLNDLSEYSTPQISESMHPIDKNRDDKPSDGIDVVTTSLKEEEDSPVVTESIISYTLHPEIGLNGDVTSTDVPVIEEEFTKIPDVSIEKSDMTSVAPDIEITDVDNSDIPKKQDPNIDFPEAPILGVNDKVTHTMVTEVPKTTETISLGSQQGMTYEVEVGKPKDSEKESDIFENASQNVLSTQQSIDLTTIQDNKQFTEDIGILVTESSPKYTLNVDQNFQISTSSDILEKEDDKQSDIHDESTTLQDNLIIQESSTKGQGEIIETEIQNEIPDISDNKPKDQLPEVPEDKSTSAQFGITPEVLKEDELLNEKEQSTDKYFTESQEVNTSAIEDVGTHSGTTPKYIVDEEKHETTDVQDLSEQHTWKPQVDQTNIKNEIESSTSFVTLDQTNIEEEIESSTSFVHLETSKEIENPTVSPNIITEKVDIDIDKTFTDEKYSRTTTDKSLSEELYPSHSTYEPTQTEANTEQIPMQTVEISKETEIEENQEDNNSGIPEIIESEKVTTDSTLSSQDKGSKLPEHSTKVDYIDHTLFPGGDDKLSDNKHKLPEYEETTQSEILPTVTKSEKEYFVTEIAHALITNVAETDGFDEVESEIGTTTKISYNEESKDDKRVSSPVLSLTTQPQQQASESPEYVDHKFPEVQNEISDDNSLTTGNPEEEEPSTATSLSQQGIEEQNKVTQSIEQQNDEIENVTPIKDISVSQQSETVTENILATTSSHREEEISHEKEKEPVTESIVPNEINSEVPSEHYVPVFVQSTALPHSEISTISASISDTEKDQDSKIIDFTSIKPQNLFTDQTIATDSVTEVYEKDKSSERVEMDLTTEISKISTPKEVVVTAPLNTMEPEKSTEVTDSKELEIIKPERTTTAILQEVESSTPSILEIVSEEEKTPKPISATATEETYNLVTEEQLSDSLDISTKLPDKIVTDIDEVPISSVQDKYTTSADSNKDFIEKDVTKDPELISSDIEDETKLSSKIPESDDLTSPIPIDKEIQYEKDTETPSELSVPTEPTLTQEDIHVMTTESVEKDILDLNTDIPLSTEKHKDHKEVTHIESTHSETTPFSIELEEHTHSPVYDSSTGFSISEIPTEMNYEPHEPERGDVAENEEPIRSTEKSQLDFEDKERPETSIKDLSEQNVESSVTPIQLDNEINTDQPSVPTITEEPARRTPTTQTEELVLSSSEQTINEHELNTTEQPILTPTSLVISTEREILITSEKPIKHDQTPSAVDAGTEVIDKLPQHVPTTGKYAEEIQTDSPIDKLPDEKLSSTSPSSPIPELSKPISDEEPIEDIPSPDFAPSGAGGYGQEPDYVEEDQAFGPGTCRYGGKVYVSAQQIPRDDPCDFCFCFRSDIICLQQSCPPPIHGCHEEPIQGFCCPRYECPVSMATTLNMTTTTTTTTTTLPPHFLPHAYKGAAQRRGCQIKGHTYKVGEVVRASSGPCLHCTCGGDGQMKCDPKACTPEPMLRQMIAAAVSAKRRR